MKRLLLLLPLLAASAPSALALDPKIAEYCLRATDFAGCVETMSESDQPKRLSNIEDGLRTWSREDGSIIRLRMENILALENKSKFGRYLEYRYTREYKYSESTFTDKYKVQADCVDYTAKWKLNQPQIRGRNWRNLKKIPRDSSQYESAFEAIEVLDEFCPIINTLPKGGEVD